MAGVARAVRQTAPLSGLVVRQACSRQLVAGGGVVVRASRAVPGVRLATRCPGRRSFSHSTGWRSAAAPVVGRGGSKVWKSADEAVADIRSGSVLLSSGFGLCGIACKSGGPPERNIVWKAWNH
jgi:3-oxoacid CoA-transferase